MASLIITIISLAIFAIVAASAIYYGGQAYQSAHLNAEFDQIVNDIMAIDTAIQFAQANGTVFTTSTTFADIAALMDGTPIPPTDLVTGNCGHGHNYYVSFTNKTYQVELTIGGGTCPTDANGVSFNSDQNIGRKLCAMFPNQVDPNTGLIKNTKTLANSSGNNPNIPYPLGCWTYGGDSSQMIMITRGF